MSEKWSNASSWNHRWTNIGNLPGGGQGSCKLVQPKNGGGEPAFLKVLSRQSDMERRERLFREASAYELLSHPSIPRLIESNAHQYKDLECRLYIVTEYIPGPTLQRAVDENGPFGLSDAIALTRKVLITLASFHSKDWVHRDIKPDNVVLRDGNAHEPVLVDFGTSYAPSGEFNTANWQELGNRFLRLPELAPHSPVKRDVRSDLSFATGLLFFALTGQHPATLLDEVSAMPHQRSQTLRELKSSAGSRFWNLCRFFDTGFANELATRFKSATEMLDALDNVGREAPIGSDMSIPELQKTLSQRLATQANAKLGIIRAANKSVMDRVQTVHLEVLKELAGVYHSCQSNFIASNAAITNTLGFVHFGDSHKQYMPKIESQVVGTELVVTFDGTMILRKDAFTGDIPASFDEDLRRRYLLGLIQLTEEP